MIEAAKTSQEKGYETSKDKYAQIEGKGHKGRLIFSSMAIPWQV